MGNTAPMRLAIQSLGEANGFRHRFCFSGSNDHTTRQWDVANGLLVRTFIGHEACVWSVATAEDGYLYTGGDDSELALV